MNFEEKKLTVLVVEDDPGSLKLMYLYLKNDFIILSANSVESAKQQISDNEVDIILLDLSLEGDEHGLDFVRFLRKEKAWMKLPVIAVSAHVFESDRLNAFNAGCDDFLNKPVYRAAVIEKINQYLIGNS
ncbi:response regulator [bacterium]|nr:response regulator [bacterium]